MFTGIIKDTGCIFSVEQEQGTRYRRVTVFSRAVTQLLKKGDSVAVNGVCLTAVKLSRLKGCFEVDMLQTSLEKTSLAQLRKNDRVNLELPLRVGDRLGGHFVQGHVECAGAIVKIEEQEVGSEKNRYFHIRVPRQSMKYMTLEGSVALDGISLTIAGVDVQTSSITVNVIPHTFYHTNLAEKKEKSIVNIEPDMLIKHLTSLAERASIDWSSEDK